MNCFNVDPSSKTSTPYCESKPCCATSTRVSAFVIGFILIIGAVCLHTNLPAACSMGSIGGILVLATLIAQVRWCKSRADSPNQTKRSSLTPEIASSTPEVLSDEETLVQFRKLAPIACQDSNLEQFNRFFSDYRACINKTIDQLGNTPLHHVIESEHSEQKVALLLALGANPNLKNLLGETPFHQAVYTQTDLPIIYWT